MVIYRRKRSVRRPTHPGAVLRRVWLDELGLSQSEFAVLIGRVLKTSPRMWMNLQTNLDIWEAEQKAGAA
jgi:plasmid maintenance system antidote protein VapI